MYNGKMFQPAQFDFWTFIHFIGCFALTAFLCLFTTSVYGACFIAVLWAVSWEYSQATAYKSEEGVDPLDLAADLVGIGFVFLNYVRML